MNSLEQNTERHASDQMFGGLIVGAIIDKLLTQKEVAEWTGMSSAWFEMSRFKGTGIPYVKIGRSVRYRTSDVQRWIESNVIGAGV